MITSILVGYDGSASAKRALDFAVDLARRFQAPLHVLAVARPPDMGAEVETEAMIEQGTAHCRRIVHDVQRRLQGSGIDVHCDVAVGHPAEQIMRYAEGHGVDHIVMGHRGHTLFERLLVGSTARQVVAHARCNVTIVRA